jgi:hypothetical protein
VVTQRGFWRLRGCPRHGGHVVNEWIGRFTVAALSDCHRRIITVLSFYLAGRRPGRLEQPTEPSDCGLPLVSRRGRAAGVLYLAAPGSPVPHPNHGLFAGYRLCLQRPSLVVHRPRYCPKKELASAITLGGVQMNLAGIVGPALGGLLLPIVGPAMLFSLNAFAFLTMAWVISQRYHRRRRPEPHLENFLESFATAARYVRYTPGMQVILTRDFLFGLFIAAVPALVPVVALHHLRLQVSQLGLVFTSMGIGSLLGATLLLPYARAKASPNVLTILAGVIQVAVLVLMAMVPNLWMFLPVTALAGISWTVSASELWVAGQRAMPDWARGRMNAVHLMASQGGVAVGGVCWGGAATYAGLGPTLLGGTLLLTASAPSQ